MMRFSSLSLPLTISFLLLPLACPGAGTTGDGDGDGDGGNVTPPANLCVADDDFAYARPPTAAVLPNGGDLDTSCLGNPEVLGAGTVTQVEGCIDIFGIGRKAKPNLRLSVYSIDQNPSTDAPAFGEVDVAVAALPGELQSLAADCESEGFFRILGIPTHEPLIWKVYDTDTGAQKQAVDTYTYDIVLRSSEIVDDVLTYEANLIYRTTYDSIPTLGGKRVEGQSDISDGVGRAIIAGEIQDCQDRIVQYAVVATSLADSETATRYFNGNLDDPSPDLTINATNNDGVYVHLNVTTGEGNNQHTVMAGILDPTCEGDDCQCLTMGSSTVFVFPDSVTLVTLRGDLPVAD